MTSFRSAGGWRTSGDREPRRCPILVLCLTNIAILAVNIRQPAIVLVVLSCTAVLIYLAYLIAIAALLVQRLRRRWPRPDSQGQVCRGP